MGARNIRGRVMLAHISIALIELISAFHSVIPATSFLPDSQWDQLHRYSIDILWHASPPSDSQPHAIAIMISLYLCLLLIGWGAVQAADCVYDSNDPSSNCLLFCIINFSQPPQKRYYNQTSHNCEPLNGCPLIINTPYIYDYATNCCYDSPAMGTVIASPTTDINTTIVNNFKAVDFVCIQGTMTLSVATQTKFCACNLFWVSSGNATATGMWLKCDMVETNFSKVFRNITYKNGVAVTYNNFTAKQVEALLQNALNLQDLLRNQQAQNRQVSVNFLLQSLRKEPLMESSEVPFVVVACIMMAGVAGVTIFHYWKSRIKITRSRLQKRLQQVVNSPSSND